MTATRKDENTVIIETPDLNVTLFAREDVPIDRKSIDEIRAFASLARTIHEMPPGFFGDVEPAIKRCILTPDFHRGSGIPVGTVFDAEGFVVPKAVGRDIGCGMRLLVTDLTPEELERAAPTVDARLRHVFFEGGREIGLTQRQRAGIFREGLQGLVAEQTPETGIWKWWDKTQQEEDVHRAHNLGRFASNSWPALADFEAGSGTDVTYDDQTGSVGGGNHFVEVQTVDAVLDHATAHQWGLGRGQVTIMAHSGSVGIGAMVGNHFMDLASSLHPRGTPSPSHGFHVLPTDGPHQDTTVAYLHAMRAAANFAAANRLFLGLMAIRAFSEALGRDVWHRLVYDAPHNFAWGSPGQHSHLHRKGACPATGPDGDPEFPSGHPVIVPGSMGSASFVLRGHGNTASLCSACHGAGRVAPRGAARLKKSNELSRLRVISKLRPEILRMRPDIAGEVERGLLEEAPECYKDITPVIKTITGASIASSVARLHPILTIKG